MKKRMSTMLASIFAFETMAQSASPESADDTLLMVYILAGALLLIMLLVAGVALYAIRVLGILTESIRRKDGISHVPQESWWHRFAQKMNASVPVDQEKNIELEHSYDGIRELDNHLPPWWTALFYGSIAFAAIYFFIYHVAGTLPLSEDEYKHELAMADEQVRKYQASRPQAVIDEATIEYTADPAAIENGRAVFISNNCGGCHRNDGGGNTIGPNLADEYWLHGGHVRDVFATIKNGVVEKGMPAWGKSMSAQDVRDVTFFVMSLQGTNPPEAKEPQGEIYRQVNTQADTLKRQAGL